MRSHAKAPSALCGLFIALLMLALTASPALATTGHAFADSFGIPDSNDPGGFQGGPAGIAIDQSTGDVYLSDPGHTPEPRIERFSEAGLFQGEIAIDPSLYSNPGAVAFDPAGSGSVYVAAGDVVNGNSLVLKYSAAGTFAYAIGFTGTGTAFNNPAIAVDSVDGTVYVAASDTDIGGPVVAKFDNTGTYLGKFFGSRGSPDGAFASIYNLAVDGSHHLHVVDGAKERVDRYSAAGVWEATVDDGSRGGPVAVGSDPVTDEVYAVENGPSGQQVSWFGAGGATRLETFGAGHIATAYAIAVNHSSGTVFVPDAGARLVERFVTFTGPTVTTTAAAPVDPSSETLNGTINPEGIASTYRFEYGQDTNYGNTTADVAAGSGSSDVPATDVATGLLPHTLYHVRIVGTNATGSIYGNDQIFTSAPAPPTLDGTAPFVSALRADGATVNGTVNPHGSVTTYHFDYGTTTAYGSATPDATTDTGQNDAAVFAEPTGLAPDTTYHFRLSADNGTGGTQLGVDRTFTTAPATPGGGSDLTRLMATLTGVVNPRGSAATYHFEYGTTTAYGFATPEADAGSGNGEVAVSAPVTHLTPGAIYHVRVVALDTATGVTTTGADGTFTAVPAPVADTGALADLTGAHAAFSGDFDTHGFAGSYRFFVRSTTGTYLGKTEQTVFSAGGGLGEATGEVSDLPPGQTFEVRLSVTSAGVSTLGDPVTFSTGAPPLLPTPAMPAGDDRPTPPSNAFSLSGKAKAKSAKLTVEVPGPGTIAVSGKSVKATSKQAGAAGTVTVDVPLKSKALKALRSHKLSVSLAVRFTPTGGSAAEQTLQLSFQRKAGNR